MDAHRSSKSHATTWVLAVVAVPVLYVLSVPPLSVFVRGSPLRSSPKWLEWYCTPADRLVSTNMVLYGCMSQYLAWCWNVLAPYSPYRGEEGPELRL